VAWWLACAAPSPEVRPHDGYVWQRVWTEEVVRAVADAGPPFDRLRVNAAAVHVDGVERHPVDRAALVGRAVIPVIRVDDAADPEAELLGDLVAGLVADWRSAGIEVVGAEVDHDRGTASLAEYAAQVRALRERAEVPLSITALPAWRASERLPELLSAADEVVLQVHAVDPPSEGLFDRARALDAVRDVVGLTDRPVWVAVPAYGVHLGADGRVTAEVEPLAGSGGRELRVDPAEVARFLAELPPEVAGVVWFRLPTAADRRAWPVEAIRAVRAGQVPRGLPEAEATAGPPGAWDLAVVNRGLAWVPDPTVQVEGDCAAADALAGVGLTRAAGGWSFALQTVLDPGRRAPLGWVRCDTAPSLEVR
jgi:hypothetical protein